MKNFRAVILFTSILLSTGLWRASAQEIRPEYRGLAELLDSLTGFPPTGGNTVEFFRSGMDKLNLLVPDIMAAKDYVHMEYFIFDRSEESRLVRTALELKGLDSLEVRYIVEDMMNIPHSPSYFNRMRKSGVDVRHWRVMRLNRRNHQKAVIIDGKIGYCGGMNIGRHYFYEWKDAHVRLTGPCVEQLEAIYDGMWKRVHGKESAAASKVESTAEDGGVIVQLVDDVPLKANPILDSYCWMLDHCTDYVYLQTPYFTPPKKLMEALKNAVARGVDVRLLIPEKTDMWIVDPANRSYYKECIEAGVRIFESSGKFDHSKIFAADDYLCGVGSANLDGRSLNLCYENNAYFYDAALALDIKGQILRDMEEAVEITLETIQSWSIGKKIGNAAARILAPQL